MGAYPGDYGSSTCIIHVIRICSGAGAPLMHIHDRDVFKGHWFNYCLQMLSATFNFLSLMLPIIINFCLGYVEY